MGSARPLPVTSSTSSAKGDAIETQNLTKRYGRFTAVDRLSILVPRGGVVGFVGPNGAGKTTTIRMLMGLLRPTEGDAYVLGVPVSKPKLYLSHVGALIESPAFYAPLSGRRNLVALAKLGGHNVERVSELLARVNLQDAEEKPYKSYSLGMKQRLGIAAALLPDPELLILDEPTNGLDPAGIREIRTLLRDLGSQGKTVFVSSHLMSEVQRMCDRLVVLRQGKLLFQGPVDELLKRHQGLVAAPEDRRQMPALVALVRASGYPFEERAEDLFVGAPPSWASDLNRRAFAVGITLRELRSQASDLEETVLQMTGGKNE